MIAPRDTTTDSWPAAPGPEGWVDPEAAGVAVRRIPTDDGGSVAVLVVLDSDGDQVAAVGDPDGWDRDLSFAETAAEAGGAVIAGVALPHLPRCSTTWGQQPAGRP